jgi:hypothetical protein
MTRLCLGILIKAMFENQMKKLGLLVFAPVVFLWFYQCRDRGMTCEELRAETLQLNCVLKIKEKEIRHHRRWLIGEKLDSAYARFAIQELKKLHEDARVGDWFVKIKGDSLFHLIEHRANGVVMDHVYFRPCAGAFYPDLEGDSCSRAAVQYDSLELLLRNRPKTIVSQ